MSYPLQFIPPGPTFVLDVRIQIGMFRPIRVDHTNCLQVVIKTYDYCWMLLEVRIFQRDGPLVFRFPYTPSVRLIETIQCVCSVFFVHRVPHVCRFYRVLFLLFVRVPLVF
jgi:hypothetical protein